jgi:hypothetical protein
MASFVFKASRMKHAAGRTFRWGGWSRAEGRDDKAIIAEPEAEGVRQDTDYGLGSA